MSKASELIKEMNEEGLDGTPLAGFKRVAYRDSERGTHVPTNKHNLNASTIIGWFSNKYNKFGWGLHKATPEEKKEFGSNALRSLSDKGTNIIKFDLKKGTYSFIDDKAYEDGDVKYDKAAPYSNVILDKKENVKYF